MGLFDTSGRGGERGAAEKASSPLGGLGSRTSAPDDNLSEIDPPEKKWEKGGSAVAQADTRAHLQTATLAQE